MDLEDNVSARRAAEEAMEYVECCLNDYLDHGIGSSDGTRFWEELEKLLKKRLNRPDCRPKKKTTIRMTDTIAKRFGHELMPFGEFVGKRVDDVPLERLEWYAGQTFTDDLRKYLRSGRIERENDGTDNV